MKKHFKLTNETKINSFGVKLYRIEATTYFECVRFGDKGGSVKAGDKGGWVESEDNLAGTAWIADDAEAFGKAKVYGYALMRDRSKAYGSAVVGDFAVLTGSARVGDNAEASGSARVHGEARLLGDSVATREVYFSRYVWFLTLSDNHITYGCATATVTEWVEWLDSDEEIETPRGSEKFKLIEMSLRLAIEQHKQRQ